MRPDNKIAVAGAGSLGKLVGNIIASRGDLTNLYAFYDDDKEGGVEFPSLGAHAKIEGDLDDLKKLAHGLNPIIAIGDVDTRKELYEDLYEDTGAVIFYTAVDRSVRLSHTTPNSVGMGTIIKQNAVIEPDAQIGVNCVIGNGVIICHDTEIGSHSRISPGVTICGNVILGEGSYLCPGVTVDKDVEIGEGVTVTSGISVWKDLPDGCTVYHQAEIEEL